MTKQSMDRIIQRPLLHTNQLRLIFLKLFKRFTKQVKQLQLNNNNAAPEAMADKTTREKKNNNKKKNG